MNNIWIKHTLAMTAALMGMVAVAEMLDRPQGVRIGERMTLKPYVSASFSYDSNATGGKHGSDDCIWTVNPGLNLDYKAETWSLVANAYYQYNAYCKNRETSDSNYHGYGEDLTFRWNDGMEAEKGWSVMLLESFRRITPTDSMALDEGRSYSSDRNEVRFGGIVERAFGGGWHANINGSYYLLDYDKSNNLGYNGGLYGWDRWTVGSEAGWVASRWTDLLVSASYQGFHQDNGEGVQNSRVSNDSDGFSLMGGIGTHATERISYRFLAGWSHFSYGGSHGGDANGFTYSASARWHIGQTWDTMLLATSQYQPSEREYGSCQRVDSVSWGVGKALLRGKLTSTFDIAYRRDTHEYSELNTCGYDVNVLTFRFGLNYYLNRYFSTFGNLEYRTSILNDDGYGSHSESYDYDQFRATVGMRLTY